MFKSELSRLFFDYLRVYVFLTEYLDFKNTLSAEQINDLKNAFKNAWSSEINHELILAATNDMDRFFDIAGRLKYFLSAL